jgi:hypothetical protein
MRDPEIIETAPKLSEGDNVLEQDIGNGDYELTHARKLEQKKKIGGLSFLTQTLLG